MAMLRRVVFVASSLVAAVACATQTSRSEGLPPEASRIVMRALQAAEQRDLTALRSLMVPDFRWSFGGDRDVDQAIEAWREDSRYLSEMVGVLRRGRHIDVRVYGTSRANRIYCPGIGGMNFRAGLIETANGWRMEYFLAGD